MLFLKEKGRSQQLQFALARAPVPPALVSGVSFTSTKLLALFIATVSMPGNDPAIFRKRAWKQQQTGTNKGISLCNSSDSDSSKAQGVALVGEWESTNLHVDSRFSACFNEHHAELFGLRFPFFCRNLPFL
mmetsp:Transcript_7587/g.19465  ORF Transcript_7587/g.19465 Transcript_7587/m.19465 type:complete len:131 (-) Transcript_7587:159-551(-)